MEVSGARRVHTRTRGVEVRQLAQFCVVGSVGLIVNLAVYAMCVGKAHLVPLGAASVAFAIAVAHNYLLNRFWTFRRARAAFAVQGARFLTVSVGSLALNFVLLSTLLAASLGKVPAQAIAIALVAPASFLGNKLWSFRTGDRLDLQVRLNHRFISERAGGLSGAVKRGLETARDRYVGAMSAEYVLGERVAGKASLREGLRYLRHLIVLRLDLRILRLVKFGIVGASGLLVNTALLALLAQFTRLQVVVCVVIATEASIAWNFALSDKWVFAGTAERQGRLRRFALFAAVNNTAIALSGPLIWLLVSGLELRYVLANLLSIVGLILARFVVCETFIWDARRERRTEAAFRLKERRVAVLAASESP